LFLPTSLPLSLFMDMYSELTSGVGQLNTWAVYKGHIHVSGKKSTTFGTRPPSAIIFSYNFQLTIVQYHLSSNKRLIDKSK
jgi:hypothetical protein